MQVDEPLGHDLERGARDLWGSRGRGRWGVGDGGVNHHGGRSRGVQQAHGRAFEDNHHSTSLSLSQTLSFGRSRHEITRHLFRKTLSGRKHSSVYMAMFSSKTSVRCPRHCPCRIWRDTDTFLPRRPELDWLTVTHGTEGRRAEVRWGDTLVTLPTVSFPIILLHSTPLFLSFLIPSSSISIYTNWYW